MPLCLALLYAYTLYVRDTLSSEFAAPALTLHSWSRSNPLIGVRIQQETVICLC